MDPQVKQIMELVEKFQESIRSQYGKFTVEQEIIDGRHKAIMTDEEGHRYVLVMAFGQQGTSLVAVPEDQEDVEISLTALERTLLEAVTNRVVYIIGKKFSAKTGWELMDIGMVFGKKAGRVFASFNDEGLVITDGEWDENGFEDEEE